jgi:hypothetical protein
MIEVKKALWIQFISMFMALAAGFGGGVLLAVEANDRALAQYIAKRNADDAQRQQIISDMNVDWKATIDALTACNARQAESYSKVTVLYGRGDLFSTSGLKLSLFGGAMNLPLGQAVGLEPTWIIPAKIKPMATGAGGGAGVFYYVDVKTHQLEGPFLPQTSPSGGAQ